MSLQETLKFGHGFDEPLYFGQNRFLTPIQIDITIKMNSSGFSFDINDEGGFLNV